MTTIESILDRITEQLPIQNPLHAFVHNNILQMFETYPFFDGVEQAARVYQTRPYWPIQKYREAFENGKISRKILFEVANEYCLKNKVILDIDLEKILLKQTFRDFDRSFKLPQIRLSEVWESQFGELFSRMVQDICVPLLSTYLDQGMMQTESPYQSAKFIDFFVDYVLQSPAWNFAGAVELKKRVKAFDGNVLASIEQELRQSHVSEPEWQTYLSELIFSLKGWSGMFYRMERFADLGLTQQKFRRFSDWVLVRLWVEHSLYAYFEKKYKMSRTQILELRTQLGSDFASESAVHRIWQIAYEKSEQARCLGVLKAEWSAKDTATTSEPLQPHWQAVFCIDDREESMRRHLEKTVPGLVTFGAVGFFNIPMIFHRFEGGNPSNQCPPVITPQKHVYEVVNESEKHALKNGYFFEFLTSFGFYYHSRSLLRGFVSSIAVGFLSVLPLISKVHAPGLFHEMRRRIFALLKGEVNTELALDQSDGFNLEQMAEMVFSFLKGFGFKPEKNLRWFWIVGHGGTSTNNPFRQAYGCGACGGNSGHPNSRAFAKMANDSKVREIIRAKGLELPEELKFIPAYHDTTSDEFVVFDLGQFSANEQLEIKQMAESFETAAALNSQERCKRLAPELVSRGSEVCAAHVKERAYDLAQPRPEYGHSTVAWAFVGRRDLTRFANLQRRSFLVSYDDAQDPDGRWLNEVILGAVPVCANISLDYYFSTVDNAGWGAGSKLPLNVTSLLGVMTGSKSDLRIGLSAQMVEIHEPLRITVCIETTDAKLRRVIGGHPRLKNMVKNGWFHLLRIDPLTRDVTEFDMDISS